MTTVFQKHVQDWCNCQRCLLHKHRAQVVLARGDVPCDVLFIGEAPGVSEDVIGQPFIGPAGKLLDRIIEGALNGIEPAPRYALTNLVACIPLAEYQIDEVKRRGKTEEPPAEAIKACNSRLVEFVRICKPRLIVLVGKLAKRHIYGAAQFRLDNVAASPEWIPRDKFLEFVEIDHPAHILRAHVASQGLLVQRAVVTLADAFTQL